MHRQETVAPFAVDNDPRPNKLEISELTKHFGGAHGGQ